MSQQISRRRQSSEPGNLTRAGAVMHWLGMIAMVIGLFAPLANQQSATASVMTPERALMKAAQQPFDTDVSSFSRVVLTGNFQSQIGCGDWDTNCDQTRLQNNAGFWTGIFDVPPGSWDWELVAIDRDNREYSIDDGQIQVNDGQIGLYAEFNSASRESDVHAVTNYAEISASGSFGTVALDQDNDGFIARAVNVDSDGWYDFQTRIGDQTFDNGANLFQGTNTITFDADGNVINVESEGYAAVIVARIDANGEPLTGACFEIEGPNQTVSRACDADDTDDGSTVLHFPAGFEPGTYTLRETQPANGEQAAPDQQIDLFGGNAYADVQSAGPMQPTGIETGTGDLVVLRQDADGTPLGGACFELRNANGQSVASACDEDGDIPDDGRIGLLGVPTGTYTLHETRTPDGFEPAADREITISANEALEQPVQSNPSDIGGGEVGSGDLVVLRQDTDGNSLGGACFELRDANGQSVASACDEDGDIPDDGRIGLLGVPTGTYTLHETRTPDGFEPATDRDATISPDQPVQIPVQSASTTELPPADEVGRVIVYRTDDQENPVGGSCFAVVDSNGQELARNCDEDGLTADDGTTGIIDTPVGSHTIVETRTPDGYEKAPDTPVNVQTGDTEVSIASARTSVEPPASDVGRIAIYRTDDLGTPLVDTCFDLLDSNGSTVDHGCAGDGNLGDTGGATLTFENVAPGDYTLHETQVPDGYQPAADTDITVTAGQMAHVNIATEPTATGSPPQVGSTLVVEYPVIDGQLICFELGATGGIASMEMPFACDNGQNDADPAEGVVRIENLQPGSFLLEIYQGPEFLTSPEPQPIELRDGETASITLQAPVSLSTSLTVLTTDGTNPVAGACYVLDEDQQQCDDGSSAIVFGDIAPGQHTVRIITVPDGYQTPDPDSQTIDVAADGSTVATFQLQLATTTFAITVTDGESLVGDACFVINGFDPFCDDGGGTFSVRAFPGEHTITLTSVPDGYELPDLAVQTVDIAADGSTVVTFEIHKPARTSLAVQTTDGTNPVAGACYVLDEDQQQCDDGSSAIVFGDIAPGQHTVRIITVPDGYQTPEPDSQTIDVAADGSSVATFQLEAATTTFNIVTSDGENALGGACFSIDTSEPFCDDGSGTRIVEVYPGEHVITITSAPAGFDVPDLASQTVSVEPDGSTVVTFVLAQSTVDIVVTTVDEQTSEPIPGACYTLNNGDPVCDSGAGEVVFEGVAPGEQHLHMQTAPQGFEPADDQVIPDGVTTLEVPLISAVGSIAVTVTDAASNPVVDACVTLDGIEPPTCTSDDGTATISDVAVGEHTVAVTNVPAGFEMPDPASQTADVQGGGVVPVSFTLASAPATTGTLQITTTTDGVNMSGACFSLNGEAPICDTDNDGVVQVADLAPGTYQVEMTTVPDDYETPDGQPASISAGATTDLQFVLEVVVEPGSVTVRTMDTNSNVLNGACYSLVAEDGVLDTQCDQSPADGAVQFANVPVGTYQLVQTKSPSAKFQTAPSRFVTVEESKDTLVEIVMDLRPGSLTVRTVDQGEPTLVLENVCYQLVGATVFGPFCDADDGTVDGQVRFVNLPAGDYQLQQTTPPVGYDAAADRTVTIIGNTSLQVTVQNQKTPPPPETGTLVVIPLDPNGQPAPGGCYQVFSDNTPISQRVCDNADSTPASITIANLPVGDFTLREMLAPSPDWQIAPNMPITISNAQVTTVEVPHQFKPGNVVVQAVNSVGLPLQGACFTLTDATGSEICTDVTGSVNVNGLVPGTRQLTQTKAPFGFKLNATPRNVSVLPGQTTTVRVVFESAPPPNTGTLQVQKFFCPAGSGGERTVFLGGAQGNQELQRTANCTPGVAHFELTAEDGSTQSNATFQTNAEGRAQLTAVNGTYILRETNPKLGNNSAARIRIVTGEMTTVIVINYVAPPKPAPVTINVEGYTCAPGFGGSSFVDFQNSCMASSQLTNQITVRAQSTGSFRRVTGDTGVRGKTQFADLAAGTYTIWNERPQTMPVTYLFCGADVNNPALKAVNGSIVTALQSGDTITCRVFQVPPLFDAIHGAIQVEKFNCPISERQRGYDYKSECARATQPIEFEILQIGPKGNTNPQPVRLSTNADGIVQFPMLNPGVYKLTEVGGQWCFAQSNSVDANGDVVVNANKLSEVWIYNCVGTKLPPNTGSGDAAGLLNPVGTPVSPVNVLPQLMWPTVLLIGWMAWRRQTQA